MNPNPHQSTHDDPIEEDHRRDPDWDFDEKNRDYLDYIIAQLQSARKQTYHAQQQAAQIVLEAQKQERSLWSLYEHYLHIGARWRQEKTGSGDIRKPAGTLLWVEEPGPVEITDSSALDSWMREHLQAVLELAVAVNSSGVNSPLPCSEAGNSPTRQASADSALSEAVLHFYQKTQMLPGGCRLGSPRHVLRLE